MGRGYEAQGLNLASEKCTNYVYTISILVCTMINSNSSIHGVYVMCTSGMMWSYIRE